ncbi:MFS general substrate transporter [Hypoxylon sp. FL1150]|nr:MFS general substrate transporter [Hypoxylon sp. FL1150]
MILSHDDKKLHHAVTVTPLPHDDGSLPRTDDAEAVTPGSGGSDSGDDQGCDNYLDGGSVAWRQVIASHLINTMACGYSAAFGIYQLYYTESLQLPSAQISWIGSVQIFLNNITCMAAGRLSDMGYARETVLVGSFIALLGTFMTSLATEYWQIFLAQGVCTGVGLGLMYMPTVTIVASYFKQKRALALSISSAGTGTGSIIFPAVVQYLIPRIGFPWAVRCAGFVALFIIVLANLLLRPRLVSKKKAGSLVDWTAFREPPYVIFVTGSFLFYWALYFGYFYINAYAISFASFTPTSAVSLLLITNAVGIPARPLIGYVADTYLGPLNTFVLTVASLAVTFFAWIAIATPSTMYAFAVLFGVANSAASSAFAAALASPSLSKDPAKIGTRFGMCCALLGLATVSGPPTAGAIIDFCGGTYVWAQVWAGLVTMMGAATVAVARCWVVGAKVKVKV